MFIQLRKYRRGFTLIELLVVVALIGILTGIVLGISGMAKRKSTIGKARAEMQEISNALEEYRIQYGAYPEYDGKITDGGFAVALNRLTKTMNNPVPDMPTKDPWGRGYNYLSEDGYSFTLKSEGQKTGDGSDDIDNTAGEL